jgi:hypothetical protein
LSRHSAGEIAAEIEFSRIVVRPRLHRKDNQPKAIEVLSPDIGLSGIRRVAARYEPSGDSAFQRSWGLCARSVTEHEVSKRRRAVLSDIAPAKRLALSLALRDRNRRGPKPNMLPLLVEGQAAKSVRNHYMREGGSRPRMPIRWQMRTQRRSYRKLRMCDQRCRALLMTTNEPRSTGFELFREADQFERRALVRADVRRPVS